MPSFSQFLAQAACTGAGTTGRPTLRIASKKRRGLPYKELKKIAVTLTAIATIAHTGVDQAGSCERNAGTVEEESQRDVLDHLPVASSTDIASLGKRRQAVRENDDVRRLDCDIGAAAHRDADVSLHQSRRIVDAVADHCHPGISLQLPHDPSLVLRQYAGAHLVDAHFLPDPLSRTLIVARDQDRLEPCIAQCHHGRDGIGPKRIAQGHDTQCAPVPCERNQPGLSDDDRASGNTGSLRQIVDEVTSNAIGC